MKQTDKLTGAALHKGRIARELSLTRLAKLSGYSIASVAKHEGRGDKELLPKATRKYLAAFKRFDTAGQKKAAKKSTRKLTKPTRADIDSASIVTVMSSSEALSYVSAVVGMVEDIAVEHNIQPWFKVSSGKSLDNKIQIVISIN